MNTISDWNDIVTIAHVARVSVYTVRRRWEQRHVVLRLPPLACGYLPRDATERLIADLRNYRGQYRKRK